VKRINKIFEEGAEFSGVIINEITPYNKIILQCKRLFNLYLKLEKS